MTTQPRTASEALTAARAFEKAKQILSDGYTFEEDKETSQVAVCKPGKEFAAYWISTEKDANLWEGCSCPAFQSNGKICKHVIAWEIWKETVAGFKLTVNHGDGTFKLEKFTEDELEAEACEMDLASYLRWKEMEEAREWGLFR